VEHELALQELEQLHLDQESRIDALSSSLSEQQSENLPGLWTKTWLKSISSLLAEARSKEQEINKRETKLLSLGLIEKVSTKFRNSLELLIGQFLTVSLQIQMKEGDAAELKAAIHGATKAGKTSGAGVNAVVLGEARRCLMRLEAERQSQRLWQAPSSQCSGTPFVLATVLVLMLGYYPLPTSN